LLILRTLVIEINSQAFAACGRRRAIYSSQFKQATRNIGKHGHDEQNASSPSSSDHDEAA
jgi:hypothetical protein